MIKQQFAMKRQVASSKLDTFDTVKEKLPLSAKCHKNHGAIAVSKLIENGNPTKHKNEVAQVVKTEKKGQKALDKKDRDPLSIKRKISFLMSFIPIALYLALFLHVIPCRVRDCQLREVWTLALKKTHLITDLEYLENGDRNQVVVLGFSSDGNSSFEREWYLGAVGANTGKLHWRKTLTFEPRHFKCHKDAGNETTKCLVFGYSDIAYFNVSNGYVFWRRQVFSDIFPDYVLPEVIHGSNVSTIIYAVDRNNNGVFLNVLELDTGFKLTSVEIPCKSLPVLTHRVDDLGNLLLVCRKDKVTDVWMIPATAFFLGEEDVLKENQIIFKYQLNDIGLAMKIIPLTSNDHVILTNSAVVLGSTSSTKAVWKFNVENFTVIDAVVGRFRSEEEEVAVLLEDMAGKTEESGNSSVELDHEMNELDQWHDTNHGNGNDPIVDISYYAINFTGSVSVSRILTLQATNSFATLAENRLLVAQEANADLRIVQYMLNDLSSTCAS